MSNEYIYNRYNGIITTYKKLNDNVYICLETGFTVDLNLELMLGKTSENITDLIEVGDYVNGYRVLDIMEDMKTGEIHLEMPMDYTNEEIGDCTIYNKDIKSIATKEQFKSVEYKVGG